MFEKQEKQIELYRSINIRCDDVLENLRKATPCFIVWTHADSINSVNSEQKPTCFDKCQPTVATDRVCRTFTYILEIGIIIEVLACQDKKRNYCT